MDRCKYFGSVNIIILVILALYGVSGIIRNYYEISSVEFNTSPWPLNLTPIYIVLSIGQALIIIGSAFGIIGSIQKNATLLFCTAFIYIGVFVPAFVFGIMMCKSSWSSKSELNHLLLKLIREENQDVDSKYFKWMSDFQYENNCCGIYSYMDYNQFNISSNLLPKSSVPNTCCSHQYQIPSLNCGKGILHENKSIQDISSILYNEGCGTKFSTIHSKSLFDIGLELNIIALISFGIAIFIYFGIYNTFSLVMGGGIGNNLRLISNDDERFFLAMNSNHGQPSNMAQKPDGDNNFTQSSMRLDENANVSRQYFRRPQLCPKSSKKFGPSSRQRRAQQAQAQAQAQAQNVGFSRPPPSSQLSQLEKDSIVVKNTEMLFHTACDKFSIQSTCPYSSTSGNLFTSTAETTDSKTNEAGSGGTTTKEKKSFGSLLPFYSSLPQVQRQQSPPGSHHHQKIVKKPGTTKQISNFNNPYPYNAYNTIPIIKKPHYDENNNSSSNNANSSSLVDNSIVSASATVIGFNNENNENNVPTMNNFDTLRELGEQSQSPSSTVIIIENIAEHVASATNLCTIQEAEESSSTQLVKIKSSKSIDDAELLLVELDELNPKLNVEEETNGIIDNANTANTALTTTTSLEFSNSFELGQESTFNYGEIQDSEESSGGGQLPVIDI